MFSDTNAALKLASDRLNLKYRIKMTITLKNRWAVWTRNENQFSLSLWCGLYHLAECCVSGAQMPVMWRTSHDH